VGQEAVGQLEKSQLGAVISERVTSGVDSTRQKLELINPKLQQQREDARVSAMGEFTAEMAEKIAQLEDATHELRAELGEALAREESLKRSLAQRHVHGVAPGSDERPAATGAGGGAGPRRAPAGGGGGGGARGAGARAGAAAALLGAAGFARAVGARHWRERRDCCCCGGCCYARTASLHSSDRRAGGRLLLVRGATAG
jgi:hypothetical protein